MNITDQEIEKLKATRTDDEWNRVCDQIKSDRGGQWPPDWWAKVMLSGIIGEATTRFRGGK